MSLYTKKFPLIIVVAILIKSGTLHSQSLSGVYFSQYEKEIISSSNTNSSQSGEPEKTRYSDTTSSYYQIFIILDFINEKEVIIKYPDQITTLGKYTVKNNKLKIISNELTASGIIKENEEIVLHTREFGIKYEKVFAPISKTFIANNPQEEFSFFSDTYWELSSDQNPDGINYYYHILDRSSAIITSIDGDYARSFAIETEFEAYKNHLFLIFLKHLMRDTRVYHIQKYDTNEIQEETARIGMEIKAFSESVFQESSFQIKKITALTDNKE